MKNRRLLFILLLLPSCTRTVQPEGDFQSPSEKMNRKFSEKHQLDLEQQIFSKKVCSKKIEKPKQEKIPNWVSTKIENNFSYKQTEQFCPVHKLKLKNLEVDVIFGLINSSEFPSNKTVAEKFPYGMNFVLGGCWYLATEPIFRPQCFTCVQKWKEWERLSEIEKFRKEYEQERKELELLSRSGRSRKFKLKKSMDNRVWRMVMQAMLHFESGNLAKAKALLKEVLAVEPSNMDARIFENQIISSKKESQTSTKE